MKSKRNYNIHTIIFCLCLAVYTAICFYLYYNQLLYPITGKFEADTPVHVSMAVEDHFWYSITAFVYLFFSLFSISKILTALMLAVATSLAVYLTAVLADRIFDAYDITVCRPVVYTLAFLANFAMGFYVRRFNVQHYIGYQNANMWHNSTYTVMRVVALWALILYFDIVKSGDRSFKKLWIYSMALALTTAVKPSFLVVFAPVMAIGLLFDLIFRHDNFKNVFSLGLTVVPSLVVIVLQSMVLFGGDTGNGYAISPFTALSQRGDHPKVTLILSILFPLMVFATHIKKAFSDRIYGYSLLTWLMGFLEVFLFTETGSRGGDGNFFWGYSIALFVVFLESAIIVVRDVYSWRAGVLGLCMKICTIACGAVFVWHALSGVWYLALLLKGYTYFV